MKNALNSVLLTRPKSNVFDLSHDVKLSFNMGQLIPTLIQECVPGDHFNLGSEAMIRFAPLTAPIMHRFDVTMHYFFVPNRILWEGWEDFITNTDSGTGVPAFPTLTINQANETLLTDYMGIPPKATAGNSGDEIISAMPFAAYIKIWNEFYRDQNLQVALDDVLIDGDNTAANADLLKLCRVCWEHDINTSALPFAQRGPAVDLPLGDVVVKEHSVGSFNSPKFRGVNDDLPAEGDVQGQGTTGDMQLDDGMTVKASYLDPMGTLTVDATTINDLRTAWALQGWAERNAVGGGRYVENILAHFGVRSSDKRLQRPEYIVGVKNPVVIGQVENTTGTEGELPQGNLAGTGMAIARGKYGRYFCEEHGFIVGLMNVKPKTAYQQGIERSFLKTTDFTQYYWPKFAHLGEEGMQNREVYAFQGGTGQNVFGYQSRYIDYKYKNSRVAGDYRTSLDYWHAARIFATAPALNNLFVECTTDDRYFAVTDPDVQKMYAHVFHKIKAVRPMPVYGTPSTI